MKQMFKQNTQKFVDILKLLKATVEFYFFSILK